MLCIVERLWSLLAFINRVLGRNVLGTWINDVLAFCRVGRKYVGCIELLFELYRASLCYVTL